ncbi:MAG: DUF5519 family protein [Actinobacteria bacterium]|nr:DUF5519 family protein [Actinomycetota bacterium]
MLKYRSQAEILRARRGAPPRTTLAYPHEQLTQSGTVALRERLHERAGALPGVIEGSNSTSTPGIRTFLLESEFAEGPREAFLAGGEFAHLHPDGSLHLTLPRDLGDEVVVQGWGEVHVDAGARRGSPIFMMIYAPRDEDELEAVWRIFRMSYEFALGLL